VGAGVLKAVRGVRVGLLAALEAALVRLLAGVRPDVDLEVLRPREGLLAQVAAVGLLLGVGAGVDEHLVAGVESPIAALASPPAAVVESVCEGGDRMSLCHVLRQGLQCVKNSAMTKGYLGLIGKNKGESYHIYFIQYLISILTINFILFLSI